MSPLRSACRLVDAGGELTYFLTHFIKIIFSAYHLLYLIVYNSASPVLLELFIKKEFHGSTSNEYPGITSTPLRCIDFSHRSWLAPT